MRRAVISLWLAGLVAIAACRHEPRPGTVHDEAMRAGLTPEQLRPATDDYFHDMDYNVVDGDPSRRPSRQPEIEGRNMWMVWTGGNDRLWDRLTVGQPRQLRSAQDDLVAPESARTRAR